MKLSLLPDLLFYLISGLALFCAARAVVTPHILRAAVYLMGTLLLTAGLYLILGAEFVAGVQVLVYVGGIVVLLLFAIMLTHSLHLTEAPISRSRKLLAGGVAVALSGTSCIALLSTAFPKATQLSPFQGGSDEVRAIGRTLLERGATGYLLPFELISLLLLVAVIGGIIIARKDPTAAELEVPK